MKIQRITCGTASDLPDEIIEYILLWLPVLSLLRFRCVCKFWRCLISSQSFIESHLRIYGKNGNKRIIFEDFFFSRTIHHCSFNSLLPGSVVTSAKFGFPIKIYGSKEIVGSVDGLICILVNRAYFCLWNPSTRKFKVLPEMNNKFHTISITICGFGFDEFSRDYKVVASYDLDKITKVYSLKSNSWKPVEGYEGGVLPICIGKFADGKLHWGRTARSSERIEIISFHLMKEVWEKMDLPHYCLEGFFSCVGVGVGRAAYLSVQCANLGLGIDVYKCSRPNVVDTVSCVGPNDIILFLQMKSSRYVVKGNLSKDGGRIIKADDHSKKAYIARKNIKLAWIHCESLVAIL